MSSNEYMRIYMLNRYRERKKLAQKYLGNKCKGCGSDKNLQFDHIERNGKKFTIAKIWSYSEKKFWEEIKKCQLLCRICHNKKTLKELGFKEAKGFHGTISTYVYCKCDLCKKAKSDWSKKKYWEEHKERKNFREIIHGTRAGYLKEVRKKLLICSMCRVANNKYCYQRAHPIAV